MASQAGENGGSNPVTPNKDNDINNPGLADLGKVK